VKKLTFSAFVAVLCLFYFCYLAESARRRTIWGSTGVQGSLARVNCARYGGRARTPGELLDSQTMRCFCDNCSGPGAIRRSRRPAARRRSRLPPRHPVRVFRSHFTEVADLGRRAPGPWSHLPRPGALRLRRSGTARARRVRSSRGRGAKRRTVALPVRASRRLRRRFNAAQTFNKAPQSFFLGGGGMKKCSHAFLKYTLNE